MSKLHERPSGFACPQCGGFLPVSIDSLLQSTAISCPNCSLILTIDREESKRAIAALHKVQHAHELVDEASRFNG